MIKDISIQTELAPPLPTLPSGRPFLIIKLDNLPSYNDILYLTPRKRAGLLRAERNKGYWTAIKGVAPVLNIPVIIRPRIVVIKGKDYTVKTRELQRFITGYPIFTLLRVTRQRSKKDPDKADRKRDVYNPAIKSFIDGFTDAGAWEDDNEEYHTDFWIHYAGVADTPDYSLEFYERR